jgi:hypothetical protein
MRHGAFIGSDVTSRRLLRLPPGSIRVKRNIMAVSSSSPFITALCHVVSLARACELFSDRAGLVAGHCLLFLRPNQ